MISKAFKLLVACVLFTDTTKAEDFDDTAKTIGQIIEQNGFRFEEYNVTSSDGYIGTVHRIPSDTPNAKPVFFQHGQNGASITWVYNEPDRTPAFVMARAGYDVWMGNNRGNLYNRWHTTLDPKVKPTEYWQGTGWEEMGIYDTPAQIDFVLSKTGFSQIECYIGYSRGTTQFFAGAALMPDYYNSKVKMFVALAPVAKISGNGFLLDIIAWMAVRIMHMW